MHEAPGQVGDPLKFAVVPNLFFTLINPNDHMQTVGSVKTIRIIVSNIIAIGLVLQQVSQGFDTYVSISQNVSYIWSVHLF